MQQQERLLGDLQNDIHQVADGLPGLWTALASNLTAATIEANQTEPGEWQAPGAEKSLLIPEGTRGRPKSQRTPPPPRSVLAQGGGSAPAGLG